MADANPKSLFTAVLVAGAISMAITLVRLYGELEHWQPQVFATGAGGGLAPLSITFLVPIFGFWFGRRLAAGGRRPAATGRALGVYVLLAGLFVGLFWVVVGTSLVPDWSHRAYATNLGAAVLGLCACLVWPAAWRANVGYAYLARVPVVVVQYFAITSGWDVHYAKGPPGAPTDPDYVLFLLTAAQLGMWPLGFTPIVGGLFATLGAATVRR